jgi:2-aminoadipate transaminase
MSSFLSIESPEIALAWWTQSAQRSALQNMLSLCGGRDVISFALGLPAPNQFPIKAIEDSIVKVLRGEPRALQYSPPLESLKQQVQTLMRERGVNCSTEQIFLTCGAQQGMNLLARLLLDAGDGKVLLEELAYTGFQQILTTHGVDLLTVPADSESGMDLDAVEALLSSGARPAFIYAVTDGHNPLGVSMSLANRIRLVELAREYAVPIVEDDAYGFLHYEEECSPPLRALDDKWVLYVGSFSKILAPSLRVGWVVVPEELMLSLSIVKEATDIDTATLAQRTVSAYLDSGCHEDHIENLRSLYRCRRDAMLCALEEHFPAEARWHKPTSGFFIWLELPATINTTDLLKVAIEEENVAFIPGEVFNVGRRRGPTSALRLNFSHPSPENIEEGIARLGRLINRY